MNINGSECVVDTTITNDTNKRSPSNLRLIFPRASGIMIPADLKKAQAPSGTIGTLLAWMELA